MHLKLGLVKISVKAMNQEEAAFTYLWEKLKDGIFIGPQIWDLIKDEYFDSPSRCAIIIVIIYYTPSVHNNNVVM